MTRPWRAVLAVIVLAAVAGGIWLLAGPSRSADRNAAKPEEHRAGDGHPEEAGVVRLTSEKRQELGVTVAAVQPRVPQAQLAVTGRIAGNPDRTVAVTARTPGRVVKVDAQLGDTVAAGAVLASIDSVDIADAIGELAQGESALALAEATAERERKLYEAKRRVLEAAQQQASAEAALRELAGVELGRAKQEYIGALAKLELAQAEHERQKQLVDAKIGARKELVRSEKELLGARAEVDAVAETIRIGARQDLLAAEIALQQARTQRDRVRSKLRLLGVTDAMMADALKNPAGQRSTVSLVAPFAGTVIERQVSEGQLVDPSAVLFRLADLRTVWALLDVPESEVDAVRRGQEAVIEAGRDGAVSHTGKVVYVADVVDDQTRTVKVRVEVPNPGRHFKPGMFVTARVATGNAGPAVLMVPKDAVVLLDEGPTVFVEDGEAFRARAVEVGQEMGGWVTVRKGLQAGKRIATAGTFVLKAQLVKAKLGEE